MEEQQRKIFGKPLLLVVIALSLLLPVLSCGREKILQPYTLTFIQPRIDIDGNSGFSGHNEIVRVYYETSEENEHAIKIEYSVVFRDEDKPAGDEAYDQQRKSKYGRLADIETILIHYDENTGRANRIDFLGTYSGAQEFMTLAPRHYSNSISIPSHDIYINTWNHLFAEYDTNPGLKKLLWILEDGEYRCENGLVADFVEGSRMDAEEWAKNLD